MKKTVSIILGVIILIVILANIQNIIAHIKKYSFDHNKIITTETKVVTEHEISEILFQQMHLAEKLRDSPKNSLIGKEVQKGYEEATDDEAFLHYNPQIQSIKIELPITKYKDDNKTITFISGEGKVLKILEKNGIWKDFNKKITPEIINNYGDK